MQIFKNYCNFVTDKATHLNIILTPETSTVSEHIINLHNLRISCHNSAVECRSMHLFLPETSLSHVQWHQHGVPVLRMRVPTPAPSWFNLPVPTPHWLCNLQWLRRPQTSCCAVKMSADAHTQQSRRLIRVQLTQTSLITRWMII